MTAVIVFDAPWRQNTDGSMPGLEQALAQLSAMHDEASLWQQPVQLPPGVAKRTIVDDRCGGIVFDRDPQGKLIGRYNLGEEPFPLYHHLTP